MVEVNGKVMENPFFVGKLKLVMGKPLNFIAQFLCDLD